MATTDVLPQLHEQQVERHGRRRPFSTWVRKLTNFKNASTSHEGSRQNGAKRGYHIKMHPKKRMQQKNNPYPESGHPGGTSRNGAQDSSLSFSTARTDSASATSSEGRSPHSSLEGHAPPTTGARSVAPTVSTDYEAARSISAPSHLTSGGGTSRTVTESRRGGDSTFSSPAPSVRSLTTTLTTIHSTAQNGHSTTPTTQHHNATQSIHFSQPFPSTPASAVPAHLAPASTLGHPTTYNTATANNMLTDNASILTLASSSKNRRRRSFDTDASVRALAPSSLWGGSRESLPLSVLSANMEASSGVPSTPGLHSQGSRIPGPERSSIYSASGIVPALPSERNSFYAKQSLAGDAASVRSGLMSHGRADSVSGSIGGLVGPLASPMEAPEQPALGEEDEAVVLQKDKEEKEEKSDTQEKSPMDGSK